MASGQAPPRLDRAQIQAVIRSHLGKIRHCYEIALAKDPKLAGKVAVTFIIGRDGKVSSAALSGSLTPEVDRCIVKAFEMLVFPPPRGGIVQVSYPLVFTTP